MIRGQLRGEDGIGLMGGEREQEEADDDGHDGREWGEAAQHETGRWRMPLRVLASERFAAAAKTGRQRSSRSARAPGHEARSVRRLSRRAAARHG